MRRLALWTMLGFLLVGVAIEAPIRRLVAHGAGKESRSATTLTPVKVKVDVNHADRAEISRLPGMTPKIVERIIQNRPYRKLDELISKKVIGKKHFAEIREYIVVGQSGM